MKNFDHRWKRLARRSRAAGSRDEQAPLGFASRVVARSFQPTKPSIDFTWDRLLTRFLLRATLLLALCAALEWQDRRDARSLDPGIEDAVAQLVWKL